MNSSNQAMPKRGRFTVAAGKLMMSLVILLFFVRGFATVLLYSLVPKLKSLFDLTYAEVMVTQLFFFSGYLVFSFPAALVLARVGYIRAIVVGLTIMITGCLIVSPAAWLGIYSGFLIALFVVASGITLLQVASNPLIAVIGEPQTAHSRLTLAQAFNSVGTAVGPLVAAWVVFGSTKPAHTYVAETVRMIDVQAIQFPFVAIASVLAIVALVFWANRDYPVAKTNPFNANVASGIRLLKGGPFLLGAISIFAYVGAEVAVGSTMINYLMQSTVLAISAFEASKLVSLYWGGAMVGRFIGSAVLRVVSPPVALCVCGSGALFLALLSCSTTGIVAAGAIIAVGMFNSIMFPTIFALAIEDLGDSMPEGSGILCMAIIGGAIVPLLTGIVADLRGLTFSLLIPAICYAWVAFYGAYMRWHSPLMVA